MIGLLAFVPLYDPLPALFPQMSDYWLWLVLPLVIAISIVYKCTRIESVRALPRESAIMSLQIMLVMAFAAAILAGGYYGYVHVAGPIMPYR